MKENKQLQSRGPNLWWLCLSTHPKCKPGQPTKSGQVVVSRGQQEVLNTPIFLFFFYIFVEEKGFTGQGHAETNLEEPTWFFLPVRLGHVDQR
jgi:hypothetical protein